MLEFLDAPVPFIVSVLRRYKVSLKNNLHDSTSFIFGITFSRIFCSTALISESSLGVLKPSVFAKLTFN